MEQMWRTMLLSIFIVVIKGNYQVLGYSGSERMKLVEPQDGPKFEYFRDKEPKISEVKDAVWFWSGPDNSPQCPMTIIIQDQIQITCLKKPIYLFVGADDSFTGSFLGNQFSGRSWNETIRFDITPKILTCNKTFTLTITALNDYKQDSINCSASNYAGLIYGVIQQGNISCCLTSQYYNQSTCQCQSCSLITSLCSTCTDTNLCLTCQIGSHLQNNKCISVCGNGVLTGIQQCDDGNLNNSDGCSSSCIIQEYFQCSQKINQTSVCKFNATFKIFAKEILKQFYENKITVVFNIKPSLDIFQQLDFSKILYSNSQGIFNVSYKYFDKGLILCQFYYSQNLERSFLNFSFNFKLISTQFQETEVIHTNIEIVTTTNIPVIYFSQNIYYLSNIFQKWCSLLIYISLFIFILSSFSYQIIGEQLIKVFQISYFSLGYTDKIHPLLTPILTYKHFNFYNQNFNFFSLKVPSNIKSIDYSHDIISNINLFLILLVLLILLSIVINFLKNIFNKKITNIFIKISNKLIGQTIYILLLPQCINIGLSISLQILYGQLKIQNKITIISFLLIVLFLIFNLIYGKTRNKFKQNIKSNKQSQSYFVLSILYLLMIGIMIGLLNNTLIVSYIIFSFSVFFLIYFLSILPFKISYFNKTISLKQISICSILIIRMLYKHINYQKYKTTENWIIYTSFIEYGLLSLCTMSSTICVFYQLINKLKTLLICKKHKNNINIRDKINRIQCLRQQTIQNLN